MSADDDASVPEPEVLGSADEGVATGNELPEKEESQKHEESTMIDVHAPHGGLHTWKDFWIIWGTITLGLLIAISLEQSVEWAHRQHRRHQLEADLHAEAEANHSSALVDIAMNEKIAAWLVELQRDVEQARATGGKAVFVYPARPDGTPDSTRLVAYQVPATEVWTTAKESELVALLPRDEADIYARLYIQTDQVAATRDRAREFGIQQGAFETRFAHGTYPPVFELSRLSPQQLDEYEALLAEELEAIRIARVRLKIFAAANDCTLSVGTIVAEMRQAVVRANMQ